MKTKRRGGFFGIRKFKTLSDNKRNCNRFADEFNKIHDYAVDKYCKSNKEQCKKYEYSNQTNPNTDVLRQYCNTKVIDEYDFRRNGKSVKKRTEPFIGDKGFISTFGYKPWEDKWPNYYVKTDDEYRLKESTEV